MQIGAINSVNFKGDYDYSPAYGNNDINHEDFQASMDFIDRAVEKANQNVHPSTILVTVAGVAAAALAGMKVVPYLRKGVIKLGELAASGAVKVGRTIADAARKAVKKPLKGSPDETLTKIAAKAKTLREGAPLTETGLSEGLNKIMGHVKDVFGADSKPTKAIENVMKNFNIKNGAGLTDAALSTGIALATLDPISDKTEQHSDKKDIENALQIASKILA